MPGCPFLISFILFIDKFSKKIEDVFIDSNWINWLFINVFSLVENCIKEQGPSMMSLQSDLRYSHIGEAGSLVM